MKEINKTTKIVGIIGLVIITSIIAYRCYDDYKWKKYEETHNKTDNLLNVECNYDEELENVILCNIGTSEKTSNYNSLSVDIKHSANIKYLSHSIPSETRVYNSHEVTVSDYEDSIRERYFITGLGEVEDLTYPLNMKYEIIDDSLDNELVFSYLSLISDDYVYHHNDEIIINLKDLKETLDNDGTHLVD